MIVSSPGGAETNTQPQQHQQTSQLTIGGIIALGLILWATAQSAGTEVRRVINLLLATLLVSMIVLNWYKISPLFVQGG